MLWGWNVVLLVAPRTHTRETEVTTVFWWYAGILTSLSVFIIILATALCSILPLLLVLLPQFLIVQ